MVHTLVPAVLAGIPVLFSESTYYLSSEVYKRVPQSCAERSSAAPKRGLASLAGHTLLRPWSPLTENHLKFAFVNRVSMIYWKCFARHFLLLEMLIRGQYGDNSENFGNTSGTIRGQFGTLRGYFGNNTETIRNTSGTLREQFGNASPAYRNFEFETLQLTRQKVKRA